MWLYIIIIILYTSANFMVTLYFIFVAHVVFYLSLHHTFRDILYLLIIL
jgi:hypothetical protein